MVISESNLKKKQHLCIKPLITLNLNLDHFSGQCFEQTVLETASTSHFSSTAAILSTLGLGAI